MTCWFWHNWTYKRLTVDGSTSCGTIPVLITIRECSRCGRKDRVIGYDCSKLHKWVRIK